jgi:DNA-binding response OmpR family regulator
MGGVILERGRLLSSSAMESKEKYSVLLVDDDASMLSSMEAVLSDDFRVRSTSSPSVAARLLERDTYHVVCADWHMPEMNGLEFFRSITRMKIDVVPSLILVTAHTAELLDPVFAEERKNLGILRKPFSPVELLERVHQFAVLAKLRESTGKLRSAVKGSR